ncbi:YHYH protein [Algoriphagus aquimarinus]|uniref:YHYH protein n=1 Tax=Algoriphagus aquimarinus TaxID=237018 RepID=A0A1I0W090_9BACT|nr:YHYH protein [Algoriphagus aquimarinus]SFA81620.1 YHYH protein [Algoriphagus aquimarinus]
MKKAQVIILISLLICSVVWIASISRIDRIATENSGNVVEVDPALFLEGTTVTKVPCTLSDGTATDCYQIVAKGLPTDHEMGPWCPDNISDDAEAGGIWMKDGEVYDVDGAFIENMASFYNDDTWHMYDADGNIYKTETIEDCENAANPNVGEEYKNFCVECLPSYVANITQTYLIPVTPVMLDSPKYFGMGGGRPPADGAGPPLGERREGPPAGDRKAVGNRPTGGRPGPDLSGPSQRGIAFNGIVFDAPAPQDAILGAYTLAPFDDAGGHINLHAGYHYHAATGVSTKIDQADKHSAMIGYAMDGHGIYERLDAAGNEPSDLDECRGHTDEIRGYHYHVAAPGTNSFLPCLAGAYAK